MGRREVLRAGALGFFGLGLPELLRARDQAPTAGRAKACILLFMWGGPAQQDTWDPKPDAPAEYRGEFKPMATAVPGVRICEHLPRLAGHMKRLALIRSMTHPDVNHTTATHYLLTGRGVPRQGGPRDEDWPTYGAVLDALGRGRGPLPPFVSMMPIVPNGAPRFVEESHGQDAGWLGPRYHPLRIDADASKVDYRVGDFSLRADVPEPRNDARRQLLRDLDVQRRGLEQQLEVGALEAHYERAFGLLAARGATAAFDLTREPLAVRERYGMNAHGQSVLQARRLVEAGVPLVTVFWPNDGLKNVILSISRRGCAQLPIRRSARSWRISTLAVCWTRRWCCGPAKWEGRRASVRAWKAGPGPGATAATTGRTFSRRCWQVAASRVGWSMAPATVTPPTRRRTRPPLPTSQRQYITAWESTRR
jgi:hypothetical protein